MFISGKKLLPVPVGWRDNITLVLHSSEGGSIDRAHNVVLLMRRDTDIQEMEL